MSRTCPQCSTSYDEEVIHCPEDGTDLSNVEPDDELIGRSIGSYKIYKALGKGGMGAVYAAEHPVIGSKVAIKFLHPQYATDSKIVDRFFNEARAVNVIGHDNILKILDLNVTGDNRHYFIMEFLIGKPLQQLVEEGKPNTLEVTGPILLQFCEALEAAHSHKIYHRDVKPDNVYLIVHKGRKNFVKVVDFGIAKLTDAGGASTGQTQTGMVMGTPAYMSPEQAGGMTNRIDARSDIYSTAVMMFQMATGKLPFPGTSFGEVLIGHLQLPPPNPRDLCPEVPEAYEKVILKGLAKKQEDRQQSMKELHDEIKAVMDSLGISSELPLAEEKDLPAANTSALKLANLPYKTPARPSAAKTTVGRPSSQPGKGRSNPPVPEATMALAPPPAALPAPGKTGMIIAVAVAAVLLIGGGIGFSVWSAGQRAAEAQQHEIQIAAMRAAEAARKAAEDAAAAIAKEKANALVFISVISDPLGANVEAEWKLEGQSEPQQKKGTSPMQFEVPKNTKVRFTFTKAGFLPYTQDVIADRADVVKAPMVPEPKVVAAAAMGGSNSPGKKKKQTEKTEEDNGETLKIDF